MERERESNAVKRCKCHVEGICKFKEYCLNENYGIFHYFESRVAYQCIYFKVCMYNKCAFCLLYQPMLLLIFS